MSKFSDEFEKARKLGKKEFTYKKKRFLTKREGESKKDHARALSYYNKELKKDKVSMKKLKDIPKRKVTKKSKKEPYVGLSSSEKKKGYRSKTRLDYDPEGNPLDKSIKKISKGIDKDIFITSGDRSRDYTGSRKNHSEQMARDMGFGTNTHLNTEDKKLASMQLIRDGMRVGGKSDHLHSDNRRKERQKQLLNQVNSLERDEEYYIKKGNKRKARSKRKKINDLTSGKTGAKSTVFTEDGNLNHDFLKAARISEDDNRNIISRAKNYNPKKMTDGEVKEFIKRRETTSDKKMKKANIKSGIPMILGEDIMSKERQSVGTPSKKKKKKKKETISDKIKREVSAVTPQKKEKDVLVDDTEMMKLALNDMPKKDEEVEALKDQEEQYVKEEAQREFPLMDTGVRLASVQQASDDADYNESFGKKISKKEKEEVEEEKIAEVITPVLEPTNIAAATTVHDSSAAEVIRRKSIAPVVQEEMGAADQFKEALKFFAPTLIGGAIGGIFEGGRGAVLGMERGHTLGQAFAKQQERRQERQDKFDMANLKARNKGLDVKTFVNSKTGSPVGYDKRQKKYVDPTTGKVVPSNTVTHATAYRQDKSLGMRNRELEDKNTRFLKRFDLDKQKLSQLSDKQTEALRDYDSVLLSIERMKKLQGKVDTGIIASATGDLLELFDAAPKGFTTLKSNTNQALAIYVKSISGAQVANDEAKRLGLIIPKMTDNDQVFRNKLKIFEKIMEDNKGAMTRAIKKGQPLKTVIGLEDAVKQLEKGSNSIPSDADIEKMTKEELETYMGQ